MLAPTQPPPIADLEECTSNLLNYRDLLRNKKIFITGATGVIGKWLLYSLLHADRILSLNIGIGILTRNPAAFLSHASNLANDSRITIHQGDIRSFKPPHHPQHYDYFIHGATDVAITPEAAVTIDTCINGTRNALHLAQAFNTRRFLLISSGAVYGKSPSSLGTIAEDYIGELDFLNPNSAYAYGKRGAELLCAIEQQKSDMELPIARCFAMVGPYLPLDQHYAIGNFIYAALKNIPIEITGDGRPIRSYIYLAEVATQLIALLLKGHGGEAYNVGSEESISIKELAHRVSQILRPELPIFIRNITKHGAHSEQYIPNCHKLNRELGIHNKIDLDKAIVMTATWHKLTTLQ